MAEFAPRILLLSITLVFSGCASIPEGAQPSEQDPWERYNRSVYEFNDAVDSAVLRPVAKGYRVITPDPVEHGISNFFDNLFYPIVIVNQLLQGDVLDATKDTGRFLFNTIVGIGGIFDPATHIGLESHNEDFGQTLAVWGVPSGPYFVLPLLGPSTLRDSVGSYADSQLDPMFEYVEEPEVYYLLGLRIVDLRAQLLDLDAQLQSTYDPYAFMRDAFLQRREYLVHDGNMPRQDYYDDIYEGMEDFEAIPEPESPQEEDAAKNDEADEIPAPLPESTGSSLTNGN